MNKHSDSPIMVHGKLLVVPHHIAITKDGFRVNCRGKSYGHFKVRDYPNVEDCLSAAIQKTKQVDASDRLISSRMCVQLGERSTKNNALGMLEYTFAPEPQERD